jgi:hypothetical protein
MSLRRSGGPGLASSTSISLFHDSMLKSMVSGERATAPSRVYATYRDVLEDFAGPEDHLVGATSFIDAKALNG